MPQWIIAALLILAAAITVLVTGPRSAQSPAEAGAEAPAPVEPAPPLDEAEPGNPEQAARHSRAVETMRANWSGEVQYGLPFDALDPSLPVNASRRAVRFDPSDQYWGLPRPDAASENGAELTAIYCGSCHSLRIVMQQSKTRDGWDDLLVWMVEKQNMGEIPAEDRSVILDYLADYFSNEA